jgi:hypothetical protein
MTGMGRRTSCSSTKSSGQLEDLIEATRYVETEQKTGNVVLTIKGG